MENTTKNIEMGLRDFKLLRIRGTGAFQQAGILGMLGRCLCNIDGDAEHDGDLLQWKSDVGNIMGA